MGSRTVVKRLRNIVISVVVILVVIGGLGVGYIWVSGRGVADQSAVQPVPEPTTEKTYTPPTPAPNAKESAAIELLTSPIAPGSNASVTVRTLPGSTCKISVLYNNVASTDSGLITKAADKYGIATWSWSVGKATPIGTWPVKITCAYNNKSAFVQGDLRVTLEPQPQ